MQRQFNYSIPSLLRERQRGREREKDHICHKPLTHHTVKGNGSSNQIFYRKPNMQMCLQQFSELQYISGRDETWERKKKNDPEKNQLRRLMNISIVPSNKSCHLLQRIGKGNMCSSLELGVWHGSIKCCN